MSAIYDPAFPHDYGYYRCTECGAGFYSGGRALHQPGCSGAGYAQCSYIFGSRDRNLATNPKLRAAVSSAKE